MIFFQFKRRTIAVSECDLVWQTVTDDEAINAWVHAKGRLFEHLL